jgi:hypothetical protein
MVHMSRTVFHFLLASPVQAIGSAARMAMPPVGAALLSAYGFWSIGAGASALAAVAFVLMTVRGWAG